MTAGVDPKELARRLAQAPVAERRRLSSEYYKWTRRGAAVGGWWTVSGIILMGLAALSVFWIFEAGWPSTTYAATGMMAVVGVLLFTRGAQKEREWRATNPFRY